MNKTKTIGLFGVTANPPHNAHLRVMEEAAKSVDEVWASPVYVHPFGKKFIDYNHRLNMLSMTIEDSKNKKIKVEEADKQFYEENNEMVFSYLLLKFLGKKYPECDFKLIIGEDNYRIWDRFKYNDEIENEFGLIIVPDFGMHSTDIREVLKQGGTSEALNPRVSEYIARNNLYKV